MCERPRRETIETERVSHTKGVHNGRDAKPAKAERAETRNPRRQRGPRRETREGKEQRPRRVIAKAERATAETRNREGRVKRPRETRNPQRQRSNAKLASASHALRAEEDTRCVQKEPRKATCYVQRRSRDGRARQGVLTGYMRRREPCGRHRDDRGHVQRAHVTRGTKRMQRESGSRERTNRASEAIEHEVNTHCMVHPNAENRGVCLGGGVCGCGVHSRSVGLCRPLIGELPVGRPATVQ